MGCIFCDIVAGRAAAAIVLREAGVTAFLDARPLFKGHVLVVPDAHVETLGDLPLPSLESYFAAVQRVSIAVQQGLGADGSFVANNNRVSQSVPHLHFHVVPRRKGDGLRGFFWPRQPYAGERERDDYRDRIARALSPT